MPTPSLSARIQQAMDALGMSPADLARASKSTTATISNWRNGNVETEHVKAQQLFRIADALAVDGRWLLNGESGPLRLNDSAAEYGASHPVQSERLTIAVQLVQEALAEAGRQVPPARFAEAAKIAYELLEEGLQQAKVLRFVKTALG